jgi:hypothetical protein
VSAKNAHGLTPQQEKFAQAVVSGKSQSDAYRLAYPKSKAWKDESVRVEAAKMLANPNISLRIRSLQAAAADIAVDEVVETAVAMAALHGIPRAEFLRLMIERAMFGDWFMVQQSMGRSPLSFHGRNMGGADHE